MPKTQPVSNALSQPFFEGCRAGELRVQRCDSCAQLQFYPRIACTACDARTLRWVATSGTGTVASFTVVERAISSAYEAPYVVALIDLDEGPRLMSQLIDFEPDQIRVGAVVQVTFRAWSDDVQMPVFQPSDQGDTL